MRNSQRVVAGLLGAIVILLIAAAIWIGVAAPAATELSGERSTRSYDYADSAAVSVSGQWQVSLERGDARRVTVSFTGFQGDRL
jgi:hypothetical protein